MYNTKKITSENTIEKLRKKQWKKTCSDESSTTVGRESKLMTSLRLILNRKVEQAPVERSSLLVNRLGVDVHIAMCKRDKLHCLARQRHSLAVPKEFRNLVRSLGCTLRHRYRPSTKGNSAQTRVRLGEPIFNHGHRLLLGRDDSLAISM